MKKKEVMKSVALLLLMLFVVFPVIRVALAGSSSGSATVVNVAPSIFSPQLTDTSSNNKAGSQLDVNVEYWVSFTVSDPNSLADLDTIVIKIWGPSSTEGGADNAANHYTFRYVQSTDTWEEVGPDSGGSHLISADCQDPADQTQGSGTFRLAFKLAKIAERATTASWTIKIIVTDDSSASDSDSSLTFGVNFYSELIVNDASHGWSGLTPGASNVALTSPADGDIDITVTSNAAFNVQVKGSGDLSDGQGHTIPLSNIKVHKDTLGSAVSLTTSYQNVGGLTSLPAGENQAYSFMLWITVPNPCPAGTYTYTLYIQVVEA